MEKTIEKAKEQLLAYDLIAHNYEKYSEKREQYLSSVENIICKNLSSDMRLLDIGSGDGRRLKKIIDRVSLKEAVAIEPSKNMIDILQKRLNIPVYNNTVEDINNLNLGKFDSVTLMWNVLGHIENYNKRKNALLKLKTLLKKGGSIMFDVNNRHNAVSYGSHKVLYRRLLDFLFFNDKRGDARYEWQIGDHKIPQYGHLFTPREIEKLIKEAGLYIIDCCAICYNDGTIYKNKTKGQLFYKVGIYE